MVNNEIASFSLGLLFGLGDGVELFEEDPPEFTLGDDPPEFVFEEDPPEFVFV